MNWIRSIHGRIVVPYLGVLGAVLLGYCVFQTVTLNGYFRSATSASMRQAADAELATAGFCSAGASFDIHRSARGVARLLGSQDVAATIVAPSGRIEAESPAGAVRSLYASAGLIHRLLSGESTASGRRVAGQASCSPPRVPTTSIRSGEVLHLVIPLAPGPRPAGYAILGRSVATEDVTLRQLRVTLWLGIIVVYFMTAAIAFPMMKNALRPLSRVTATAEVIAAGALDERANLTPSVDEVGRLGTAFDMMVDRLQEALSAATVSEERMRQFLADASHELRTPLTVLCGTAQVLLRQRELEQEEIDAALAGMNEEAIRLSRLVDDLLSLSRLDAGQGLDPHPVTVSLFLQRFAERYAAAWPERSLEVDGSALNGTQVQVDPDALTRVLTNLVDNAARYSSAGTSIVLRGEAAEDTVSIMVSDEGPGLSAEDADRVFERFYRGSKSRTRSSGGAGLGLAIVHALVRESRGEIEIETGPDRGTTVAVRLPQARAA